MAAKRRERPKGRSFFYEIEVGEKLPEYLKKVHFCTIGHLKEKFRIGERAAITILAIAKLNDPHIELFRNVAFYYYKPEEVEELKKKLAQCQSS